MKAIDQLRSLAEKRGLSIVERPNGHVQIVGGAIMVNYYPLSKSRTAYLAGTTKGQKGVSPEQAVAMALKLPKVAAEKQKRRKSYRSAKLKMLAKSAKCNWCPTMLTIDTATLDHIIPVHRGGLDNANNWCLACLPCNQARGNHMPEIKQHRAALAAEG